MCVDRGCRAPRAEGGQCQRHGRLRRVAILRRETRADDGAGRGINHLVSARMRRGPLIFAVVVLATLAGSTAALATFSLERRLDVGTVRLSVDPGHRGALDLYVP